MYHKHPSQSIFFPIQKLETSEQQYRRHYENIREHYVKLMSLQAVEMAQRSKQISAHITHLSELRSIECRKRSSITQESIDKHRNLDFTGHDVEKSGNCFVSQSPSPSWNETSHDVSPVGRPPLSTPSPILDYPFDTPLRIVETSPIDDSTIWSPLSDLMKRSVTMDTPSPVQKSDQSSWCDDTPYEIKYPKHHIMECGTSTDRRINGRFGTVQDQNIQFRCDLCHSEIPLQNSNDFKKSPSQATEALVDSPGDDSSFYHCHSGYHLCKACGAATENGHSPTTGNQPMKFDDTQSGIAKGKIIETITGKIQDVSGNFDDQHELNRPSFSPVVDRVMEILPPADPYSPQPAPHTPSQVVDHRLRQGLGEGPSQSKPTLRMWWETKSPLQGEEESRVSSGETPVMLPTPHHARMNASPLGDMHLSASPKLSRNTTEVNKTSLLEATHRGGMKGDKPIEEKGKFTHPSGNAPQEILDGSGWIWHYKILKENGLIYILYMSNEDAFGCLVLNTVSVSYSAVVYDKARQLVFFVPQLEKRETQIGRHYVHPHPYITTYYKDSIVMLRAVDVMRMSGAQDDWSDSLLLSQRVTAEDHQVDDLPMYLSVIQEYADSLEGLRLPFQPPRNAKLVYLRNFCFDYTADGDPSWFMFRLSNGHAEISDERRRFKIRWLTTSSADDGMVTANGTKYIIRGGQAQIYADPKYFQQVRETLRDFDGNSHEDVCVM